MHSLPLPQEAAIADEQRTRTGRWKMLVVALVCAAPLLGEGAKGAELAGIPVLAVMDGGDATKLTDAKDGVASYAWSPQGTTVAYVSRDPEPADKAGAYGVQGHAAIFIRHLAGSYSGVMGLPLYETWELLAPALGLIGWNTQAP